jgi:hypothetical protein
MRPLYEDPHFTFRFADDRLIPRFHLEGVEVGRRISVFQIEPGTGERLGLLARATVGRRRLDGTCGADHRAGRRGVHRRTGTGSRTVTAGGSFRFGAMPESEVDQPRRVLLCFRFSATSVADDPRRMLLAGRLEAHFALQVEPCVPVPGVHLQERLEFSAVPINAALHEGHDTSPFPRCGCVCATNLHPHTERQPCTSACFTYNT